MCTATRGADLLHACAQAVLGSQAQRALHAPRLKADEVKAAAQLWQVKGQLPIPHTSGAIPVLGQDKARQLVHAVQLGAPLCLPAALGRQPHEHARGQLLVWQKEHYLGQRATNVHAKKPTQVQQLVQQGHVVATSQHALQGVRAPQGTGGALGASIQGTHQPSAQAQETNQALVRG